MTKLLYGTFFLLVLAFAVPSVASATDHTTPLKTHACVIKSPVSGVSCPAAGEANSDSDRNNEGSRLRALGWCLSSNAYAGLSTDGWNRTTIKWKWTTCKGYIIVAWFTLYWNSSQAFYDLQTGEVFPAT